MRVIIFLDFDNEDCIVVYGGRFELKGDPADIFLVVRHFSQITETTCLQKSFVHTASETRRDIILNRRSL